MSAKSRRSTSSGSSQETVIAILVITVLIETFLLVRPYFRKRGEPITSRPRQTVSRVNPVSTTVIPSPTEVVPPNIPPIPTPLPPLRGRGKIAVIIDDSGYRADECDALSRIPQPITISILPDLEFSKEIAYCAHMEHKAIMLHLPLEPHTNNEKYPDNYLIKTRMSDEMILAKVEEDLKNVPHAEGINNHMGSKATEDKRVMTIILKDLKRRNLFFIDSLTTGKSICDVVAHELKLPFGHRDIFLDNHNDRTYIEGQFNLLAQKARRQGSAIGIGHARTLTWVIVREQLGKLSREGFEIVPVHQILQSP